LHIENKQGEVLKRNIVVLHNRKIQILLNPDIYRERIQKATAFLQSYQKKPYEIRVEGENIFFPRGEMGPSIYIRRNRGYNKGILANIRVDERGVIECDGIWPNDEWLNGGEQFVQLQETLASSYIRCSVDINNRGFGFCYVNSKTGTACEEKDRSGCVEVFVHATAIKGRKKKYINNEKVSLLLQNVTWDPDRKRIVLGEGVMDDNRDDLAKPNHDRRDQGEQDTQEKKEEIRKFFLFHKKQIIEETRSIVDSGLFDGDEWTEKSIEIDGKTITIKKESSFAPPKAEISPTEILIQKK